MKQTYQSPDLEWIRFGMEDILTTSDNDAEFVPPEGETADNGWSGYH